MKISDIAEKALDFFESKKHRAQQVANRADLYRDRSETKEWIKRNDQAAREIDAVVKEHGAMFDRTEALRLDDHDVNTCIREFDACRSAIDGFIGRKRWLEALEDGHFSSSELGNFENACLLFDRQYLAPHQLRASLGSMKDQVSRLAARLAELHEYAVRQGAGTMAERIELVIPERKPTPEQPAQAVDVRFSTGPDLRR